MVDYSSSINHQYARKDLTVPILKAFNDAGVDVDSLEIDDLSNFDQLHTGGRGATRVLADMAGLTSGMQVLDIGSGLGGPARTLAAEFDCQVVGIDITTEYVKAAEMLTKLVDLNNKVSFKVGSAYDLKFDNNSFDAVWTQSTIMNIDNKQLFLREAYRVLRPKGVFAIEAFMEGSRKESEFPVIWADNSDVSFLITPEFFRDLMGQTGFQEIAWKDVTANAIARHRKSQASSAEESHPLDGIWQIIHSDLPRKAKNVLQGLENGTYKDIYAIYKRAP